MGDIVFDQDFDINHDPSLPMKRATTDLRKEKLINQATEAEGSKILSLLSNSRLAQTIFAIASLSVVYGHFTQSAGLEAYSLPKPPKQTQSI